VRSFGFKFVRSAGMKPASPHPPQSVGFVIRDCLSARVSARVLSACSVWGKSKGKGRDLRHPKEKMSSGCL